MQAALGQPLRMIPDGGVRLITCRAGELFMPRAAIINMFGEAARVLEPGGKYVTNNLLMPFDDALKRMVQYEIATIGTHPGIARIMAKKRYAEAFDEARNSGEMYAASVDEQLDMLMGAGFAEVVVKALTSPAIIDSNGEKIPFAVSVVATTPGQATV